MDLLDMRFNVKDVRLLYRRINPQSRRQFILHFNLRHWIARNIVNTTMQSVSR